MAIHVASIFLFEGLNIELSEGMDIILSLCGVSLLRAFC